MDRPTPTVADVFRRDGDAYRAEATSLSTAQRRVMTAIEQCRTAALGGHVEQCVRPKRFFGAARNIEERARSPCNWRGGGCAGNRRAR